MTYDFSIGYLNNIVIFFVFNYFLKAKEKSLIIFIFYNQYKIIKIQVNIIKS